VDLIDAVKVFIDREVDLKAIDAYIKTALHRFYENYTAINLFENALLMIQNGVARHYLCNSYTGVNLRDIAELSLLSRDIAIAREKDVKKLLNYLKRLKKLTEKHM